MEISLAGVQYNPTARTITHFRWRGARRCVSAVKQNPHRPASPRRLVCAPGVMTWLL
jgi:hypothetical protein